MSTDQPTSAVITDTATTPSESGAPLTTSAVVSVTALVALVLGAITVLTVLGKPVDNVLIILTAVIAPTVGTILASRKLDNAKSILHDVSVKVNGRLDGALSTIAALEAQVRAAGGTPVTTPVVSAPSPVTFPAPRHSAENPPSVDTTSQEVNNG